MTRTLIADIGGTNVRFAQYDKGTLHHIKIFQVAEFANPAAAAQAYLAATNSPTPKRGVFAVAGPVTGDYFELTNHSWAFSTMQTANEVGLGHLALINDFHALALGVPSVEAAQIKPIGGGHAVAQGNIGIVGPGTGLGVASLIWDRDHYVAVPGEGPHVTAPATTEREFKIFKWLADTRYSHVSAERVCSGKGLVNLYDAINALDNLHLPAKEPAQITESALNNTCKASAEALRIMLAVLGRVAGNLALTNNTRGGVYLAGGILPQIGAAYLQSSRFRGEFTAKGRFTAFVDGIPTYLINDPFLALRGLGLYAESM